MSSPRISIIIPSYNQGKYLRGAIRSVLKQDYSDFELIVMDGGSTDGSVEIIQSLSSHLKYWESTPDRGQAHAINKGFAQASGEIITFLSSDDYYLPDAFLDVAEKYNRDPGVGAIVGGFSFLEEGRNPPGDPITPFIEGSTPVDLTLGPPGKYRLHQVATFFTRSALDASGRHVQENLRYVMDRELLYRICRLYHITLSPMTYGVFRRHLQGKSAAETLPFAREFANLYLSALSGDPKTDRLRKKMAQYRLSRGYVKFAKSVHRVPGSFLALVRAGLTYPNLLSSKSYWSNYLKF